MDTLEKLKVLSADSQYDLACACAVMPDEHRRRGSDGKWLYPITMPNGGSSIMLKTLLSNACVNDCRYCPLRSDASIRRVSIAPDEMARIFMEYLERRNIFGLFLTSGVVGTPDQTMERLNGVARILRSKYRFRGYIHLKIIPGASDEAVREAVSLASAVSVNIETPGEQHLAKLSRSKNFINDIIRPLKLVARLAEESEGRRRVKKTTQFVVGASDERDAEIVRYMFGLYERLKLNRVYFSAYQSELGARNIPGEQSIGTPPAQRLLREHRLYQVDFLIRKYQFKSDDIAFNESGNLDLERDPKQVWADNHPGFYPVHLNRAEPQELLRVPGFGPRTVARILERRRSGRISSLRGLCPERLGRRAANFVRFD